MIVPSSDTGQLLWRGVERKLRKAIRETNLDEATGGSAIFLFGEEEYVPGLGGGGALMFFDFDLS